MQTISTGEHAKSANAIGEDETIAEVRQLAGRTVTAEDGGEAWEIRKGGIGGEYQSWQWRPAGRDRAGQSQPSHGSTPRGEGAQDEQRRQGMRTDMSCGRQRGAHRAERAGQEPYESDNDESPEG